LRPKYSLNIKLDTLEAKLATNSTCYYFKQQLNTSRRCQEFIGSLITEAP